MFNDQKKKKKETKHTYFDPISLLTIRHHSLLPPNFLKKSPLLSLDFNPVSRIKHLCLNFYCPPALQFSETASWTIYLIIKLKDLSANDSYDTTGLRPCWPSWLWYWRLWVLLLPFWKFIFCLFFLVLLSVKVYLCTPRVYHRPWFGR